MAETSDLVVSKTELVDDVNIISGDQIYAINDQNVVIQSGGEGSGQYPTVIQVNDQEYMVLVTEGQTVQTEDGSTLVVSAAIEEPAEPEMTVTETPRTRRTNRLFTRNRARDFKEGANNESVYDFEEEARNAANAETVEDNSVRIKDDIEDDFEFTAPKKSSKRGRPKGSKNDPKVAATLDAGAPTTAAGTSREYSGGTHACTYCDYTSTKRYLLSRHLKSHSEDRPHQCSICERGFKTLASMQNHVNTHTGIRPHTCKFCDANFTTSGELVRHVRYKHTLEKPHRCSECDYASVELSKLKRHMRCHTGERPYQCMHCTYASPDTYKLKRHLRIHTGEKPYECQTCGAKFTQSNSLKSHMLIHSGNKPVFKCPHCPTTCGRKTDLRIHMQKLHTSDKVVMCKRCDQTFTDRYLYKQHQKSHEGEKCFKCDLCSYASTSQRHLDTHMLIHTDQKPFSCAECNLTFRQKQLLKRHNNLYHTPNYVVPAPKEKTHPCSECNKSFRHKGNLMRHMYVHDPDKSIKTEYAFDSGDEDEEEEEEMEIMNGSNIQQLPDGSLSILTENGELPEGAIAFTLNDQDEKMAVGENEVLLFVQYPEGEEMGNAETIVVQPGTPRIIRKKRIKNEADVIDQSTLDESMFQIEEPEVENHNDMASCFGFKTEDDDEDDINLSMPAIDCQ